MKHITNADIEKLEKILGDNCISLYVPTHAGAHNYDLDALNFKKVLKSATTKINNLKVDKKTKEKSIEKLTSLLNKELRQRKDGSLAVFYNTKTLRSYRLSHEVKLSVKTGIKYDLLPLVLSYFDEAQYMVLSISQKEIKLFNYSEGLVKKVPISNKIGSLQDVLKIDEVYPNIQAHPSNRGGMKGARGFHGHGSFKDEHKKLIKQYFKTVDKSIYPIVNKSDKRVILAGVNYLLPIYREVTKIDKLLKKEIHGNLKGISNNELIEKVKKAK